MEFNAYQNEFNPGSQPVGLMYPESIGGNLLNKLQSFGVLERCVILRAEKSGGNHYAFLGENGFIDVIKKETPGNKDSRREDMSGRCNPGYITEGQYEESYFTASTIMQAMEKTAEGKLHSTVAIVNKPGDQLPADFSRRFWLDTYVTVATKYLLNERPELVNKFLIVGLDVCCGSSTGGISPDSKILKFSIYRNKKSLPNVYDENLNDFDKESGGYNIAVSLDDNNSGYADYSAVWDHVLIPLTMEYNPDMIVILAARDPAGGCLLAPFEYSAMLKKLMDSTCAKLVMAFDQGNELGTLLDSVLACTNVLVKDSGSLPGHPSVSTWNKIKMVCENNSQYWPVLSDELLEVMETQSSIVYQSERSIQSRGESKYVAQKFMQSSEDLQFHGSDDEQEDLTQGTHLFAVSANLPSPVKLRFVWYATYGSNMNQERFLCYIEGTKLAGMKRRCQGCRNTTVPRSSKWKTIPYRLFFGRGSSETWGAGGVAFLDCKDQNKNAYVRLYKITLEQFNDVLKQENSSFQFGRTELNYIKQEQYLTMGPLKGWYNSVLFLGEEERLPILTLTCSPDNLKKFKSKELPLKPPSEAYKKILVNALVKEAKLTNKQALDYLKEACKPLSRK